VAQILNNLGLLFYAKGEYSVSESFLHRALAIVEENSAVGNDAGLYAGNLAMLYDTERKYSDAEKLYEKAYDIATKEHGPESREAARELNNLGTMYVDQGQFSKGISLLYRALNVLQTQLGADHPDVIVGTTNLALAYWGQGDFQKAESLFEDGLSAYARQLEYLFAYMNEVDRLSFLEKPSTIFPKYYSFCFQNAKQEPAFIGKMYDTALWRKGFVVKSIAAMRRKLLTSNDEESIQLFESLAMKRSQLATLLLEVPGDNVQLKQRVQQLEEEANKIENQLLERSRGLTDDKEFTHVSWREIQAELKPGEAAVELLRFPFYDGKGWTDKTYYIALVLTQETKGAPTMVVLGEAKDLEVVPLLKYRDLSSERPVVVGFDDSAYRSLWRPLEAALGEAKTIYFSPDGLLNLVAFSVIPLDDGRRLIDTYDLRFVFSTKDLARGMSPLTAKSAVLIGDPKFDSSESAQKTTLHKRSEVTTRPETSIAEGRNNLRSQELRAGNKLLELPASKLEIASVRELLAEQGWQVEIFTRENATEEAVQGVRAPRVLHIATHAFFLPDQATLFSTRTSLKTQASILPGIEDPMLRSGLFFAGANRALKGEKSTEDLEDGILTAFEASGLNLHGTELVVLSACDTGIGKIDNGEGVFGLRRAFQEAGAQAVLMSLWAVPDRETEELMTLFYSKWLAGEDKHQALREAELELRKKVKARYGRDLPFYWGGFVLVGR